MPNKSSKKKGGSPASNHVMKLMETPVRVDGMMVVPMMKGGSGASNSVMSLVQPVCACDVNLPPAAGKMAGTVSDFYLTSGGGKTEKGKRKVNRPKKTKKGSSCNTGGGGMDYYKKRNSCNTGGGDKKRNSCYTKRRSSCQAGGSVPYYVNMKGLCNTCGGVKLINSFPSQSAGGSRKMKGGSAWLMVHNSRSANAMPIDQFKAFTNSEQFVAGGQNPKCVFNGPMFK